MCLERPFHWYKVCPIWWTFVLELGFGMNKVKNIWNCPEFCFWSSFSRLAWSYVLARASFFKSAPASILAYDNSTFALFHYFSWYALPFMYAVHIFLNFFHIKNSITPYPLIQLSCGFFCCSHHDPCNLYSLMMIFAKIVHVWILKLPRVYDDFCKNCARVFACTLLGVLIMKWWCLIQNSWNFICIN